MVFLKVWGLVLAVLIQMVVNLGLLQVTVNPLGPHWVSPLELALLELLVLGLALASLLVRVEPQDERPQA